MTALLRAAFAAGREAADAPARRSASGRSLAAMSGLARARLVVVKVGSALLVDERDRLGRPGLARRLRRATPPACARAASSC